MTRVYLGGVGLTAPGLSGWAASVPVLRGAAPYRPEPLARPTPAWLAADVRRRTTDPIRLALQVAAEATAGVGGGRAALASVFASSEADGGLTHEILEEVAKDRPEVSPTKFHNSVNNAPAGYWGLAAGSGAPSTSISADDATAAAGLLEACAQVHAEGRDVLLVVHDWPLPEPLHGVRPLTAPFACALVLTGQRPGGVAGAIAGASAAPGPPCPRGIGASCPAPAEPGPPWLEVAIGQGEETVCRDGALEGLRSGNPAGRLLPLLAVLAAGETGIVSLPYVPGLVLRVTLGLQ